MVQSTNSNSSKADLHQVMFAKVFSKFGHTACAVENMIVREVVSTTA